MADGGLLNSSLFKRVAVAVIFVPLLLWIFAVRGIPLFVFTLFVTLVGQWELFGMLGKLAPVPHRIVSYLSGFLLVSDAYFLSSTYFTAIIIAVVMSTFLIEIISGFEYRLNVVSYTVFTAVYPAALISYLLKIETLNSSVFAAHYSKLFIFFAITIWMFDSASYFAGKFFGKHRFFPKISPKKTLEGFIGGVSGALLTGLAAAFLIDQSLLIHFMGIALAVALFSQAGDLSESIIKRSTGIKDSSKIIPGHGGILDRFDSLIFAAPALYAYLYLLSCFS